MDIETRLTNLENLVNSFIKSMGLQKQYSDADINGVRKGVGDNSADIQQNTEDIDATMNGLADTYESVETNTSDIDACMNAITELYEMIEK